MNHVSLSEPVDPESTGTILVVDDNEMNRDLLSRRLRRAGHRVMVAENGRAALDQLASMPFDLVLLDIMMPELTGYEVLEIVKKDPALCHIPVVMITAATEEESIVRCLSLGADDHLPKPFNPAILRARVASSLAKKRLHDSEQRYAKSLERELEIGHEIQLGFLPETLPTADGWELRAHFRPARQVAGDFYDAFPLPNGSVALVLADVCGKGVGAALFMALFRSLLRALAETEFAAAATVPDGLCATVQGTNDYIARTHGRANMFATAFVAVLDPATGALDYVNAGHEPPAIIGSNGVRARLEPTGPALGLMPELVFGVKRERLAIGETLFAYTDGVVDARDPGDGSFGEERLMALLHTEAPAAASLLERIDAALTAHITTAAQFDDVAMLATRRTA
ncbi:MAG: response regulator receiver protein [Gemmatimonadetes bacterium]|nr:MAG: response regulator receiver protein [Gemmatimonadota bacterium]